MDGNPGHNWQGQTQNGGAHEDDLSEAQKPENFQNNVNVVTKEQFEAGQREEDVGRIILVIQDGGTNPVSANWQPTTETNTNENNNRERTVENVVSSNFVEQETHLWPADRERSVSLDKSCDVQDGGVKMGHLSPGSLEPGSKKSSALSLRLQVREDAINILDDLNRDNQTPSQVGGNPKLDKDFDINTCTFIEGNLGKDKSNTLMTPHELESMPEEGMEFEESVGPKHSGISSSLGDSVCTTFADIMNAAGSEHFAEQDLAETLEAVAHQAGDGDLSEASAPTHTGPIYIVTNTSKESGTMQKIVTINSADSRLLGQSGIFTIGGRTLPISTVTTSVVDSQSDGNTSRILSAGNDGLIIVNDAASLTQSTAIISESVKSPAGDPIAHENQVNDNEENELPDTEEMTDDEEDDASPGKVYACPEGGCGKKLASKAKLKLHVSSHTGEARPFKCDYESCEWAFTTSYKLKRHYAKHTGAKPFKCPYAHCGKYYTTVYNLKSHMKIHTRLSSLHSCDVPGCGETFATRRKLETHKRKHFDSKKFLCSHPGCSKAFSTSSALGSHVRSHQREEQIYPCNFEGCDKKFDKPCRLKLHLRSHTGERPYVCPYEGCGWAFVCLQKLTRHQRRHTGEKKYECPEEGCGKSFTRAEHLKGHLITHTGEKPFECAVCQTRFSARSSLYVHMKKHNTSEEEKEKEKVWYNCPIDSCDKVYASKTSLKNHISRLHNTVAFSEENNQFGFIYITPEDLSGATLENLGATETGATVVRISAIEETRNAANFELTPHATETNTEAVYQQDGQFDNSNIEHNSETYLASAEVERQIATASLQSEVMSQHVGNNVVTQFVVNADVDVNNATTEEQAVETTVPSSSPLEYTTRVFQANNSGSARTDFSAIQGILQRPIKRRRMFQNTGDSDLDETVVETDCITTISREIDDPVATATFTTAGVVMTSSAITLRDPATGSHYVQTQLLQDDPPSDHEIAFHPEISLTASTNSDHSSISSELPVSILQETPSNHGDDASEDFLESHSNSGSTVPSFTESTINLQDLE
ncbi:uncharacterized protein LOC100366838 [Saccoglossus kowalevskii]|uniref:Uncharacterized protein LOC100366838 n=1 Tax=Saccoglossus kowalevskii TaxID=10224 RepID=A0ABM0GYZ8_SACKO|nr:PREDICTED: uncharacterized protein LOC100366838 [Saccoglossus kowalevskii]